MEERRNREKSGTKRTEGQTARKNGAQESKRKRKGEKLHIFTPIYKIQQQHRSPTSPLRCLSCSAHWCNPSGSETMITPKG